MTETTEDGPGAAVASDDIKPYTIHVSSKYLELTRQKLELTRLPHEGSQPVSKDWWEPKPQVEPLIDFWLEKYSWRDQEAFLNETPQFRTTIAIPSAGSDAPTPLRVHFIHVPSEHHAANTVPLLLIPPFPLSNLALTHLVKLLTEPNVDDGENAISFHLVIPALPGLGFSDPFPNNTPEIATTAELLNTLMARLGYHHYLVSNAGAAQSSPATVDWSLVDFLATRYANSCVGAHLIAPPLASPKLVEAPLEWAKWTIASTLNAGILGYSAQDFSALKTQVPPGGVRGSSAKKGLTPARLGLDGVGLREPNTLAYAMCDSPTGLLVFAMKGLGLLAPGVQLTSEQIITLTNLAWLPGPEYAMRFWARCATEQAETKQIKTPSSSNKPKVAITVFLGGKDEGQADASTTLEVGEGAIRLEPPMKTDAISGYACPAWGKTHYSVLFSQRVAGKPGLLAWERPQVILAGVRGLARELLKVDKRLQPEPEPSTVPLETVAGSREDHDAHERHLEMDGGLKPPERPTLEQGDSSQTHIGSQPPPSPKSNDDGLKPPERPGLEQGDSSQTQVGSQPPSSPKGKAIDDAPTSAAATRTTTENPNEGDSPRQGTPDTIVLITRPTGEETVKE